MSSVLFTFMMISFVLPGDVFLLCVSIRCSDLFPDPRTDVGWGYRWHQIHVLSKGKNKGSRLHRYQKCWYFGIRHYFNLLMCHCIWYHICFCSSRLMKFHLLTNEMFVPWQLQCVFNLLKHVTTVQYLNVICHFAAGDLGGGAGVASGGHASVLRVGPGLRLRHRVFILQPRT